MTDLHRCWEASWTAHSSAKASAIMGEQRWWTFPHKKSTFPKWFWATTAKADLVESKAASTLILMWSEGGGDQIEGPAVEAGREVRENTLESSWNLACTFKQALFRLAYSWWKSWRFLAFQILSTRDIVQRSCVGIGAFGGFRISFRMSSPEISDATLILRPQPEVVQRALAKWHSRNRWTQVSTSASVLMNLALLKHPPSSGTLRKEKIVSDERLPWKLGSARMVTTGW